MAAPPLSDSPASTGRLTGSLGPGAIVFMVVAAAAPLTVMAGSVPIGIALGTGAAFPAMFAVAAVILLFFAVGFTAMAPYVPSAGAFYSYVTLGLGRATGLGAACLALLTYVAVQGAVYGFFGAALGDLVTSFGGPSAPWWMWSLLGLATVAVLGYRHIDLSSKVLGILLVAEIGVVLVLDAVIVFRGGGESGLSSAVLDPGQALSGSPGIALMFAIGGFIGFEATAIFRDEARHPERTIPRATYGALAVIGVFYTVSGWAIVSGWGDSGAVSEANTNTATMMADTATAYLGAAGADLVRALLVSSVFACILSFHNVIARYVFALAGASFLPRRLGRRHERHASPHAASVTVSVVAGAVLLVAIVAGLDPVTQVFAWLAGVATVGIIALMVLTCLAIIVFFRRERVLTSPWRTLIAPGIGLAGLTACLLITVDNMPLLVGGSTVLATVLGALLVAAFCAGPALAWLRRGDRLPVPTLSEDLA